LSENRVDRLLDPLLLYIYSSAAGKQISFLIFDLNFLAGAGFVGSDGATSDTGTPLPEHHQLTYPGAGGTGTGTATPNPGQTSVPPSRDEMSSKNKIRPAAIDLNDLREVKSKAYT
jgi:hypothetical protein